MLLQINYHENLLHRMCQNKKNLPIKNGHNETFINNHALSEHYLNDILFNGIINFKSCPTSNEKINDHASPNKTM